MTRWVRSLEGRLVLRIAAVFLLAAGVGGFALIREAYEAAAQLSDEALAHAFIQEFATEVAWVLPLFAAAVLGIVTWTVRRGLKPLRQASAQAERIAPASTGIRLPSKDLPDEVKPLVLAVNQAFDRIEQGFVVQRQFTARAAHELRTPLAVLTAELESLPRTPEIARLIADAGRMNRLVEQLLRVARLDALPLDVTSEVDLRRIAADTVAYLAPWAVAQDHSLTFDAPQQAVLVRGNADAIADALRNLIENAVTYSPPQTDVAIAVTGDGAVSVGDRGPGIPVEDRQHVFERFWRGRQVDTAAHGAGLGLTIVAEIARAHGATTEISEHEAGGTRFTIRFRPARS
jgi:signal transduction histidine kinase